MSYSAVWRSWGGGGTRQTGSGNLCDRCCYWVEYRHGLTGMADVPSTTAATTDGVGRNFAHNCRIIDGLLTGSGQTSMTSRVIGSIR